MHDKKYDVDEIKNRLEDFREREEDIDMQLERLEQFEMKMTSIGSPQITDMPKAPSSSLDKIGNMVALKIQLEQSIEEERELQNNERIYLESIIKKLKKAKERAVIRMKYFDGVRWDDINYLMFGDKEDFLEKELSYLRRTHMIHSAALLNMTIIIQENKQESIPSTM